MTFVPNVTYRLFQPFMKVENKWMNITNSSIKLAISKTGIATKLAEFESGLHFTFHHSMTDGT